MRRHRIRTRRPRERGYVIAMFAMLLVVLMVLSAFAIDLGAFYNTGSRLQRAADASALAAAVWVPGDLTTATSVAVDASGRNGFTNGQNGVTVSVSQTSENAVEVTITQRNVPMYFAGVVMRDYTMTRSARAEHQKPLAMGSPLNTFGNQGLSDPNAPQFWASINDVMTDRTQGDPFASKCIVAAGITPTSTCSSSNPSYRSSGYLYAIDVPADGGGRQLSIDVFDAGRYNRSGETYDTDLMGNSYLYQPALSYEVLLTDSTPYDLTDNPSSAGTCTTGPGRLVLAPGATGYKNNWTVVCALSATANGRYGLRVKSSGISGQPDQGSGASNYSVRATLSGAGGQPHMYGVGDMSIYTGTANSSANFYLAEVPTDSAGRRLKIEMFDPGDGPSGNYYVSVLMPNGTVPNCIYTDPSGNYGSSGTCRIQTRNSSASPANRYNGLWLTVLIDLPGNYSCTDCWWKVKYEFGGTPTDRTTWRVSMDGGPIHLVR